MTPRITFLVLVGIVLYVSLSLYHWSQVKKIPNHDKLNGAHSVLARDSHEKNWVQVSTASGEPEINRKNFPPTAPQEEFATKSETPVVPAIPPDLGGPSSGSETTASGLSNDLQAVRDENTRLRNKLNNEQRRQQLQSEKIKELHTQVITLQSTLEDVSANLEEKERALEEQKTVLSLTATEQSRTRSDQDQMLSLKASLGSKIDALETANERITALSERLDQSRLTIEEVQSTNVHLQNILADTEAAKIQATKKAEKLYGELLQTREDRDVYLAEIGRLHSELKLAKTSLTSLENELSKKQLQTEAILRYGQQQTELVVPFRQEIEILNARVDDKNKELLQAEDQIHKQLEQNKTLQKKIVALRLELQKNEHLSKELKKTSEEVVNEQQRSSELTQQLKALTAQLNNRDEMITSVKNELAQLQNAFKQAEEESSILAKKNKQQQEELQQSSQELTNLLQQLDTIKAALLEAETGLKQERTEKDQLALKLVEQQQLLEGLQGESANLASQLEETKKQLAVAIEPQDPAQKVAATPEAENIITPDKEQNELVLAQETITQLQLKLQEAESRLAETGPEIQLLKKSLAEAQTKEPDTTLTTQLQEEIHQLETTLTEEKNRQDEMSQHVIVLEKENTALQEQIKNTLNDLQKTEELESIVDRQKRELVARQENISRLQNNIQDLRSELGQRNSAIFKVQEEYSTLQEQLDSLQKERDTLFLYSIDSDEDSVSDAVDTCPGTIQGAAVGVDGCEQDDDQDGLVNRLDLCPDSSKQYKINLLGCNDGEPVILTGLYFTGGTAELSAASQSYLDGVAAILKHNKDIHLEVGGHTDSSGDVNWNRILSRQRAEAVTSYLSEKGIDSKRLIPIGYGSERPIGDNVTATGRAANRRVEFIIIAPD